MNRAINYIEAMADLFGMKPSRVQTIDKEMAASGLRRKGAGRTAPQPSLEEEIALLLALNSAASPPAWLADRKEPTIRDAASEAKHWLALHCDEAIGKEAPKYRRDTLGESLVEVVQNFPWKNTDMAISLRLELNLTKDVAYLTFSTAEKVIEHLRFSDGKECRPVDAETVTTINGRALARLAVGHR